jgi:hypothetical protein
MKKFKFSSNNEKLYTKIVKLINFLIFNDFLEYLNFVLYFFIVIFIFFIEEVFFDLVILHTLYDLSLFLNLKFLSFDELFTAEFLSQSILIVSVCNC